jgi:hypothetical protein
MVEIRVILCCEYTLGDTGTETFRDSAIPLS